jgi:hypothetical protein
MVKGEAGRVIKSEPILMRLNLIKLMVNLLSCIVNYRNRDFWFLSYRKWQFLIQLELIFTLDDLYTKPLAAMAAQC